MNKITLVTVGQGNPIALKRTIKSMSAICDEVIFGDVLIFESDRKIINGYGIKVIPLPFNYIFVNGFASVLNHLATFAKNDLCLYMNVSEVIECNLNTSIINDTWNSYKFDHATESHKWTRLWKRSQLQWSGRIHEEVIGNKYTCPDMLFRMADTNKDDTDPFYSSVMNDVKEMVYFNQYISLVDRPGEIGATNQGWVAYAKENYQHLKDRLIAKGERYNAFLEGDLDKYLENCTTFEGFENNKLIHFQ